MFKGFLAYFVIFASGINFKIADMANKGKRNRKGYGVLMEILLDPWIFVPLIIVVFEVAMIFFLRHKFVAGIEYDFLGIFGDFFGGVIGTVLTFVSVIILAMTFKQQKEITNANLKQQKEITNANLKQQDIQRFNDMFYELLRLYREQVESLSLKIFEIKKIGEGYKEVVYKGKEFFDKGKIDITNKIEEQLNDQSNSLKIMVEALELYYDFYKKNRSKLSAYYRTLYRIFEIIDKSNLIEEKEKEGYVKIVRAQLTESELFFIRYNAMSEYGRESMQYLKKYRVLNNFPFYEMLEYRHLFKGLGKKDNYNEKLNKIFNDIYDTAKLIIDKLIIEGGGSKKEETELSTKNDKHNIYINFLNERQFQIEYVFNKDGKKGLNEFKLFKEGTNLDNLQTIFRYFIIEMFVFLGINCDPEDYFLDLQEYIEFKDYDLVGKKDNSNKNNPNTIFSGIIIKKGNLIKMFKNES